MSKDYKLTIELIPKSAWFKNLRHTMTKEQWDVTRKKCYKDAGYSCEICGGKGPKWPVECHEVWDFVDGEIILKRLIALCPSCHEVKHIGLAKLKGNYDRAVNHFCKVNGCDKSEARKYISESFDVWNDRSNRKWELDLSAVEDYFK